MSLIGHSQSCACCGDLGALRLGRHSLWMGEEAALGAASGDYEAMILSCIDPARLIPARSA
jgi:hypothetical protein